MRTILRRLVGVVAFVVMIAFGVIALADWIGWRDVPPVVEFFDTARAAISGFIYALVFRAVMKGEFPRLIVTLLLLYSCVVLFEIVSGIEVVPI